MTATIRKRKLDLEILTSPLDKLPSGPRSSSLAYACIGARVRRGSSSDTRAPTAPTRFRYSKREKMDVLAGAAVTWFTGLSDFSGLLRPQVLLPSCAPVRDALFLRFAPLVLHFESLAFFLLSFASELIFCADLYQASSFFCQLCL